MIVMRFEIILRIILITSLLSWVFFLLGAECYGDEFNCGASQTNRNIFGALLGHGMCIYLIERYDYKWQRHFGVGMLFIWVIVLVIGVVGVV